MIAAPMATLYQGLDKQSAGYKMLSAMGWQEGQGLGAQKQGIKEHVRVKKKFDALGVGAAETSQTLRSWTLGMAQFDQILSKLKEVTATHDDSGSDSEHDSGSHEEQAVPKREERKQRKKAKRAAAAVGVDDEVAAPLGSLKRKKRKVLESGEAAGSDVAEPDTKKKKKKAPCDAPPESATPAAAPATTETAPGSASGTPKLASEPAPAPVGTKRLATHQGRYAKRERAKTVRNYSSTDLAAILGVSGGDGGGFGSAFPAVTAATTAAPAAEHDDEDSGKSSSDDEPKLVSDAEQHDRTAATAAGGGDAGDVGGDAPAWWSSMFVRSGRTGSSSKSGAKAAKIAVRGFSEQDQENLYHQSHAGKSQSRQGLGRSSAPKKIGGVHWAGTKTKLGSDDEEEEEDANGDAAAADNGGSGQDQDQQEQGIVIMASKAATAAVQVAAGGTPPAAGGLAGGEGAQAAGKIKWGKLAQKILEDAPQRRMRVQKLHRHILAAVGIEVATDDDELLGKMLRKLQKCSRLLVTEKRVQLQS